MKPAHPARSNSGHGAKTTQPQEEEETVVLPAPAAAAHELSTTTPAEQRTGRLSLVLHNNSSTNEADGVGASSPSAPPTEKGGVVKKWSGYSPWAVATRPKRSLERLKLCQFQGCDKVVPSRSLCSKHQKQKERATKRGQLASFMAQLVPYQRSGDHDTDNAEEEPTFVREDAGSQTKEGDESREEETEEVEEGHEEKPKDFSKHTAGTSTKSGHNDNMQNPATAQVDIFDPTKFTKVDITHLLRLPQRAAAAKLGISSSTFSRLWRESRSPNASGGWTYKQALDLEKRIETARETGQADEIETLQAQLDKLLAPSAIYVPNEKMQEIVIAREENAHVKKEAVVYPPLLPAIMPPIEKMDIPPIRPAVAQTLEAKASIEDPNLVPPRSPKQLKIKCGMCGMMGHMRTNSSCPLYHRNFLDEKAKEKGNIANPIRVKETGEKIKLSIPKSLIANKRDVRPEDLKELTARLLAEILAKPERIEPVPIPFRPTLPPLPPPPPPVHSTVSTTIAKTPVKMSEEIKKRMHALRDSKGRFTRKESVATPDPAPALASTIHVNITTTPMANITLPSLKELPTVLPPSMPVSQDISKASPDKMQSGTTTPPVKLPKKERMVTRSLSKRSLGEAVQTDAKPSPEPAQPEKKKQKTEEKKEKDKKKDKKDKKKKKESKSSDPDGEKPKQLRDSLGRFISGTPEKKVEKPKDKDKKKEKEKAKEEKKEKDKEVSSEKELASETYNSKSKKKEKRKRSSSGTNSSSTKKVHQPNAKTQKRDAFGRFVRTGEETSRDRRAKKRQKVESMQPFEAPPTNSPPLGPMPARHILPSLIDTSDDDDSSDSDDDLHVTLVRRNSDPQVWQASPSATTTTTTPKTTTVATPDKEGNAKPPKGEEDVAADVLSAFFSLIKN